LNFSRQLGNKIENKKRLGDQRCEIWKEISDADIIDIFQQGNGTNKCKKFFKNIIKIGREKRKP